MAKYEEKCRIFLLKTIKQTLIKKIAYQKVPYLVPPICHFSKANNFVPKF